MKRKSSTSAFNPTGENLVWGFTLIELLVVISIIGILATLLLANFNSTRARARDATRKSDLRNIQTALRIYYNDFGGYPTSTGSPDWKIKGCGTGTTACTWGGTFATSTATYMTILPDDPLPNEHYKYKQTGADAYSLIACLENKSDDKCDKNAGNIIPCGTDNYGCQYTVKP